MALTALPSELFGMTNLQKLDLCNNKLEVLPNEVAQLKNLKELNVRLAEASRS
jgi:Leucine-rich repeat (LRR) protein